MHFLHLGGHFLGQVLFRDIFPGIVKLEGSILENSDYLPVSHPDGIPAGVVRNSYAERCIPADKLESATRPFF